VEDNEEIWQFRDGMMGTVLDGDTSEAFPVTIGGCMLAPSLFSMVFAAVLTDAFQNSVNGIL